MGREPKNERRGGGGEGRKRLQTNPWILKTFVRQRTELVIGLACGTLLTCVDPTPLFRFLALAPFFARPKHRKSRSSVFLYSQTRRKRLLRRLCGTVRLERLAGQNLCDLQFEANGILQG